ncbi:hypothetical protein FOZ63_005240 [Perkinsus olseni]|uniref:Haloacid dehalogenase-like hydrolase domain-containing protein 3 n=2 Tax=Perkinsus olseni TaxID=32597 RepID=A0A7J6PUH6_PEROL|nr:hypothetical protein FOZ60_016734 [Perkinsus olseni]KAF4699834.1 hypothetical protein FOZ63_005240 [Perkinsus olseni]
MRIAPFNPTRAMCVVSLATSAAAAGAFRTRLLLFDLDDTLWHTVATLDGAHKAWVEYIKDKGFVDVAERYGDRKTMQPLVEGLKEEWKAGYESDPKPYWDYTVVRKYLIRKLLNGSSVKQGLGEEMDKIVEDSFEVWVKHRSDVAWFEDAPDTLLRVRQRWPHLLFGACSNGNVDLDRVPRAEGLFDFTMSAIEAGVSKPEAAIYEKAMAAAGLTPAVTAEETVFIGDDFVNDVYGPGQLGIRTVWLNADGRPRDNVCTFTGKVRAEVDVSEVKEDVMISDIRQLPDALEGMMS